MKKIEIGKKVDYEKLEKSILNIAEEFGLKVRVKDIFENVCESSGMNKKYNHTAIRLGGIMLSAMKIIIYDKSTPDEFYIQNGFLSDEMIENYVNSVLRNI